RPGRRAGRARGPPAARAPGRPRGGRRGALLPRLAPQPLHRGRAAVDRRRRDRGAHEKLRAVRREGLLLEHVQSGTLQPATAQRPAAGREELPGRAPHRRGPRDGPLTRTAPDPLITLGPARRRWPPTYRRCSGRELLGDGGGLGLAVQADPVPGLRVVDDAAVEG